MNRDDALLFALNCHINELHAGRGIGDPWLNNPFERNAHIYDSLVSWGFMVRADYNGFRPYILTQDGRDAARLVMQDKMRQFMRDDFTSRACVRKAPIGSTMFYVYEEGVRMGRVVRIGKPSVNIQLYELTKAGLDFCQTI